MIIIIKVVISSTPRLLSIGWRAVVAFLQDVSKPTKYDPTKPVQLCRNCKTAMSETSLTSHELQPKYLWMRYLYGSTILDQNSRQNDTQ